MLNRLLLSLLSIGMVAGTLQGDAQDYSEQPSYFHFRKGATGDSAMDARYKPLFWPSWAWSRICVNSEVSEKAAFVQSLQEISKRSRAGAKEGLLHGLTLGILFGAVTGAVIGSVAGHLSKTSAVNNPFVSNEREQKKLLILSKAIIGSLLGVATGGIGMAAFYIPALADEGIRVCEPSACDSWALNEYCTNAHNHAHEQLSNYSDITPALAAILEKLKNNQALSADENLELNACILPFTSTNTDRQIASWYVNKTPLADIVNEINNTNKSNRKRIPAVIAGGKLAKEYAQQNKIRTFIAASQGEYTLGRVYDELNELDRLKRMQQTYENVSRLCENWQQEADFLHGKSIVPEIIDEWK